MWNCTSTLAQRWYGSFHPREASQHQHNPYWDLFTCSLLGLLVLLVVPVSEAQPLELDYYASQDLLSRNDPVSYTVVVSNSGTAPLEATTVRVLLPASILSFAEQTDVGFDCPSTDCDQGELALWMVGDLAPGASRSFTFSTFLSSFAEMGDLRSQATASATGSSDVTTAAIVRVTSDPFVRLSVAAERTPVAPDVPVSLVVTYGNRTGERLPEAELRLRVPPSLEVVRTMAGGVVVGSDVVWDVGPLPEGQGGQARVTLRPTAVAASGLLARFEASLRSDAPAGRALVTVPLADPGANNDPLRLAFAPTQSSIRALDPVGYRLVVANAGVAPLRGTRVSLVLPPFLQRFESQPDVGFDCPSTSCEAGDLAVWEIGTLGPGESRALVFTSATGFSPPPGEILTAYARAEADGLAPVETQTDLHVPLANPLRLSAAVTPSVAQPGETVTVTYTVANAGSERLTQLDLRIPPPAAATVAATTGPVTQRDATGIAWEIDALEPAQGGRVSVRLRLDTDAVPGSLLRFPVHLSPGGETATVDAEAVVAVASVTPLVASYALSPTATDRNGTVFFETRVENPTTTTAEDVQVRFLLPPRLFSFEDQPEVGFECAFSECDAGELARWNVGALPPGQSRTLVFSTAVSAFADQGQILRSPVLVRARGQSDLGIQSDLVVGAELDYQPPPSPTALVATPGDRQVALSWTGAGTSDLAGYRVRQGVGDGPPESFDLLAEVPAPTTSVVSTGLDNGTTYVYVVTAVDAAGNESPLVDGARAEATPEDLVAPEPPADLTGTLADKAVVLSWSANTEEDLEGYRLYRDLMSAPTALLAALPQTETAYTDADVEAGTTYFYRLSAVDDDGNESALSNEVEVLVTAVSSENDPALPTAFALEGVYPNPVAGSATVAYALPEAASVTVEVLSVLGARVAVLIDAHQPPGHHELAWTPHGLAGGLYLVRLRAGTFAATQRLVLVP